MIFFLGVLIGGFFLFGLGFALGYILCHHQLTDMLLDSCHEHLKEMNDTIKRTEREIERPTVTVDRSVDLDLDHE